MADALLDGQTFHRGGAIKTMTFGASLEHVLRILGQGNGAAVDQYEDVWAYADRGFRNPMHTLHAVIERVSCLCADRAPRSKTHVCDDDVGSSTRHRSGLCLVEHVGSRQKPFGVRKADHLHLETVAHPGLFEITSKHAVNQSDRREILYA